jgi:lambda repressor-like predicted transcriptional regulator
VTNAALHAAMKAARLGIADLAQHCEVDPKTAGRWLANEHRMPHPAHRMAVCDLLGVEEQVIWPHVVRQTIKTGPDREIVTAYPTRAAAPKSLWRSLITGARNDIVFAGYTSYFLWLEQPNLHTVLRKKAERDCRVRFLVGDPESEVTRRREEAENVPLTVSTRIRITLDELAKIPATTGLEARFSDEHISLSVFVFDRDMLVCPHIATSVGHDSPTLHIRREQTDGLFDRFAYHVSELWSRGRPVG